MSKVKNIGIIAATFTGNHGAEAMIEACLGHLGSLYPGARFHVISYAPKADLKWITERHASEVGEGRLLVHSCKPFELLARWLPLSLALRVLPLLRGEAPRSSLAGIRKLLALDFVVDLAGVSFMDGREIFLPFNVLTLFPFLLHRVPVFKLSQALGPFKGPVNRALARAVLGRVELTVARGRLTYRHLETLCMDPARILYAPDTTFGLGVHGDEGTRDRDVVILPSSLVAKKNPSYESLMAETVRLLDGAGISVTLLAHSWKEGSHARRNNDFPLCERIFQRAACPNVRLLGPGLSARELKHVIAAHKVLVGSRFHGMIAALDVGTPPLVLGWGHKYAEVLKEFDLES
ncbi:MAG: hypothetical protein A3G75_07525, partial [Verrucomicrobia bacterium RIFCSPLOWO2_12_FULL_64_8]